jgi:hypothetical protein
MSGSAANDSPLASPIAREPSFLHALRAALFSPRALFGETRELTAPVPPLWFAARTGLVIGACHGAILVVYTWAVFRYLGWPSGAGAAAAATLATRLVGEPLWAIATAVAGGGLVHAISALSAGHGSFARSVRVAAYATTPLMVGRLAVLLVWFWNDAARLPFAKPLALAWWAYVVAEGVAVVHGARRTRARLLASATAIVLALVLMRLPFRPWVSFLPFAR